MRGNDDPGNSGSILGVRLVEETALKDPEKEPASGSHRVRRGGSWGGDPQYARVADRDYGAPGLRNSYLGFRLVEEVD